MSLVAQSTKLRIGLPVTKRQWRDDGSLVNMLSQTAICGCMVGMVGWRDLALALLLSFPPFHLARASGRFKFEAFFVAATFCLKLFRSRRTATNRISIQAHKKGLRRLVQFVLEFLWHERCKMRKVLCGTSGRTVSFLLALESSAMHNFLTFSASRGSVLCKTRMHDLMAESDIARPTVLGCCTVSAYRTVDDTLINKCRRRTELERSERPEAGSARTGPGPSPSIQ